MTGGYIGADDPGEADRLAAQQVGALDELRAALASVTLPRAPRVLELGCGSGVLTRALLAALPGAVVLATDRDAALLASARAALAAEVAGGRLRVEPADASSLPYPARSFDLVVCRCLLMHQPDPLVVVGEMFRVARVGGFALAIEPDWGARALYPDPDALDELLDLARRGRPFGFPELRLGRQLFALLRAGGFTELRVGVTAFSKTAQDALRDAGEVGGVTGPGRLLEQGRALLRRAGVASDATLDALIARFAALQRHPEYCSAGLDFYATGLKPQPPLDL